MPEPIDSSRFSDDAETSSFVLEKVIHTSPETLYRAWTDSEAFKKAYDPERPELSANIEMVIGGRYEWLWDGVTGGNGCQILSFIPGRMISFSWNAPPEQPESREQRTWVVVEFEPTEPNGTRLRLTHLGFGPEPHWQETRQYFEAAWQHVFEQFRKHLET